VRKILLLILVVLLINFDNKDDIPSKISLNSNWQFKGIDTLNWQSASVPGNIFTDLLDHKIIDDPFVLNNEEKVQWVSKKSWEYKTSFSLSNDVLKKNNIELNFDGLDTYATIFLNDSIIGETNNAFKTYIFDIKTTAKLTNKLRIIFNKTDEIETVLANKNPYKLPPDTRIYTRKAQFQYGWDWGPVLNTSGIWKDVSIKSWNDYKIDNIYIKQEKLTDIKATLSAEITIKSDVELESEITARVDSLNFNKKIQLKKGIHTYTIPLEIENPQLWWTFNLGDPYLYQFDFELTSNGIIKDKKSIKKGIRTIKLISERDSIGESFYFELNGKPVYMKGANYIPQNSFQNKVSDQHYEKLLSDVVKSNMNMLRVWGGGIYENDLFYELSDEKGILIWQDFMFACAMYPGDKNFLDNVKQEAEQQVKRLRNYSSIALWCGNNENSEAWKRWGWQKNRSEKEKKEIWNDYLALFDSILPNVVKEFSDTDYWETSPKYGRGDPKSKFEGDSHDWSIWHDELPFEHLEKNVPRFMSEFGFQSFPSYEAINYINQNDSINLKTDAMKGHQKHKKGFELIEKYMKRDYKIPTNDDDYVYVSQLLQAKGIVLGIEAQRRAKPYNMGTLYWQLNDCWPVISWSSIDYFGNWKALQYKAKKAFENILISSVIEDKKVKTFIVNDTFDEIEGEFKLKLLDFYGNEIWTKSQEIKVLKNSSKQFYSFSIDDYSKKNTVLIAEFNGEKTVFFSGKPKDLILPKGVIQKEVLRSEEGFSITLKSNVFQKDMFLYTKEKGHFSDNFFDLLPNQTKTIFFESKAETLIDIQIKTLNNLN
jgi:beta-mannosidase